MKFYDALCPYNQNDRIEIREAELYAGLDRLNFIAVATVLYMIPLMMLTFFLLNRHLQKPLQKMTAASRRLREGELGVTLPEEQIPNEEFAELMYAFNSMSTQLKHLFDTVYLEKMATKDAQIEALGTVLDSSINRNNDRLVRLSEELRCGEAFLYIMSMRFGKRLGENISGERQNPY